MSRTRTDAEDPSSFALRLHMFVHHLPPAPHRPPAACHEIAGYSCPGGGVASRVRPQVDQPVRVKRNNCKQ